MYKVTLQLNGPAAAYCTADDITIKGETAGFFSWKLQHSERFVSALKAFLEIDDLLLSIAKRDRSILLTALYNKPRSEAVLKDTLEKETVKLVNRRLAQYSKEFPNEKIGQLESIEIYNFARDAVVTHDLKADAKKVIQETVKYGLPQEHQAAERNESGKEQELTKLKHSESTITENGKAFDDGTVDVKAEIEDDSNPEPVDISLGSLLENNDTRISTLLQQQEFLEVANMLEPRYNRPQVIALSENMKYYSALISMEEYYDKAEEVRQHISAVIRLELRSNANDVCAAAKNSKCPKIGFLLYQIAAELYQAQSDPDDCVEGLQQCVWKMKELSECFKTPDEKRFIIDHMTPGMQSLTNVIVETDGGNNDTRALKAAMSYYCIFYVAQNSKDWEASKSIVGKGVEIMGEAFDENAKKHKVYSWLLSNDGNSLKGQKKNDKARACFEKAIDAIQDAGDIDPKQRKSLTTKYKKFLDSVPI